MPFLFSHWQCSWQVPFVVDHPLNVFPSDCPSSRSVSFHQLGDRGRAEETGLPFPTFLIVFIYFTLRYLSNLTIQSLIFALIICLLKKSLKIKKLYLPISFHFQPFMQIRVPIWCHFLSLMNFLQDFFFSRASCLLMKIFLSFYSAEKVFILPSSLFSRMQNSQLTTETSNKFPLETEEMMFVSTITVF